MTQIASDAMSAVTTVFTFITGQPELAAIALGFPVVRAAAGALKRVIKV